MMMINDDEVMMDGGDEGYADGEGGEGRDAEAGGPEVEGTGPSTADGAAGGGAVVRWAKDRREPGPRKARWG